MSTEAIRKRFEKNSDLYFDMVEFENGRYVYFDQDSQCNKTHQAIHAAWIGYQQAVKDMEANVKADAIEEALRESLNACANKNNYRWDHLSELIGNYAVKLRGQS